MSDPEDQVDRLLGQSGDGWRASLPEPEALDIAGLLRRRGSRRSLTLPTAKAASLPIVLITVVTMLALFVVGPLGSYPASNVPTTSLPPGDMTLTCDVPVIPGHCLQSVAWAVAHLPAGLEPVAAVTIMDINQCPNASPCVVRPHYDEWWAAFELRDGRRVGMWVSNAFGTNALKSADVGATPPPSVIPALGSFTLSCTAVDDVVCTGAAGGSTDLSPNKPPLTIRVEPLAGSDSHCSVTLTFEDGTAVTVEVTPDKHRDIGWSSVATNAP